MTALELYFYVAGAWLADTVYRQARPLSSGETLAMRCVVVAMWPLAVPAVLAVQAAFAWKGAKKR